MAATTPTPRRPCRPDADRARDPAHGAGRRLRRARAVPDLPAAQAADLDLHRRLPGDRARRAGQLPRAPHAARARGRARLRRPDRDRRSCSSARCCPADRHAGQQPREQRAEVRGRTSATSSTATRRCAGCETDYNITGKLEKQAEKLPARIGDAAGVLSNIGLGIVNSIFAAVTIIVLIDLHDRARGPTLARDTGRSATSPDAGRLVAAAVPAHRQRRRQLRRGRARAGHRSPGCSSWIVLLILGVPYALPLAVIVFLLDLVPLVGATLGAIIVGIVTLFMTSRSPRSSGRSGRSSTSRSRTASSSRASRRARCSVQPLDRADRGAVRLDAVRHPRRAARDPGRGRDPDHHPRVHAAAHAARRRAAARGRAAEATSRRSDPPERL